MSQVRERRRTYLRGNVSHMETYFDGLSGARQLAWWTVATRVALERWEALVAVNTRDVYDGGRQLDGPSVWHAQREHHTTLIAARHVVRAAAVIDPPLDIEQSLRDKIVSGRDLLEHWDENAPVFNVRPPTSDPPRRSGKSFAERNPGHSPYFGLTWSSKTGAMLLPDLSAKDVYGLLDRAEAHAVQIAPDLAAYMPERALSPWLPEPEKAGWWPKPST